MEQVYAAVVKRDGDWWIGWVQEVLGVNAQESTKDELIVSLREALKDILDLNREEARRADVEDFEEVPLTV